MKRADETSGLLYYLHLYETFFGFHDIPTFPNNNNSLMVSLWEKIYRDQRLSQILHSIFKTLDPVVKLKKRGSLWYFDNKTR